MTNDVLQHDDYSLDNLSDGKDEGHHGEVVEAVIQQVHDGEGADDGKRQGQAGDDGGRDIAQEQEDHQHHQAERQDHGELDVVVAFADAIGAVVEDVHVHRGRQLVAEDREQVFHAVSDFDGVGSGLALDGENDGAARELALVEPGGGLIVLDAVDDGAEFVEAHGRAVAVCDDDGFVLVGGEQLAAGLEGKGALRADDGAGGEIDVPVLEGGFDFVDADLPRGQRMRVHLHVHGVFLGALHLHLGDAGDHGDALGDAGFGVLVEGPEGQGGRGQGNIENRLVGGIDLGEGRGRGHALGQQAGGLGDGGLHVDGGAIELAGEIEFEGDLGVAERIRAGHRIEAGDGGELIFERGGHGGGHGFGAGAGEGGGDEQGGEIDIGEVADGEGAVGPAAGEGGGGHQEAGGAGAGEGGGDEQGGEIDIGEVADGEGAVGHAAEEGDGGHQEAGGDGALDKSLGDIHWLVSPLLARGGRRYTGCAFDAEARRRGEKRREAGGRGGSGFTRAPGGGASGERGGRESSELRSDAQGGAFLENRRGAGNLARSRLSGGSWAMSEPACSAESRQKAGCSQDWLPHWAAAF